MRREYYSDTITSFLETSADEILGILTKNHYFPLEQTQRNAWLEQIHILKIHLTHYEGAIYFEYAIPRMGKRIDVLLIIGPVIFVLEFKVGEMEFPAYAVDQVFDYALDLKNFHQTSHDLFIAPVLIATRAKNMPPFVTLTPQNDKLFIPIKCNRDQLDQVIASILSYADGPNIDSSDWSKEGIVLLPPL